MSEERPPSGDRSPAPAWTPEQLAALVAGELDAETARSLRARLRDDPAGTATLAEAKALEDALRAEPLLPLPLALVGRVLAAADAAPLPGAQPIGRTLFLVRVAAVVLVAFASWTLLRAEVPTLDDVALPPRVVAALPRPDLLASDLLSSEALGRPALPSQLTSWSDALTGAHALSDHEPAGEAASSGPLATILLLCLGSLLLLVGVWAARSSLSPPSPGDAP